MMAGRGVARRCAAGCRRRVCLAGLRRPRLLLAIGQRPPEPDAGGPAGDRMARRPGDVRRAQGASSSSTQRIRGFAVAELGLPDNASYKALRRPAPQRRGLERGGRAAATRSRSRPGASRSRAASATAATTTRPMRKAEARRAAGAGPGSGRLPGAGLLHAGLDELGRRRSAAHHLHRLPRRRTGAHVFHELAHQVLYVPGDTMFNESFATAVERIGGARWLAGPTSEAARLDYARRRARRAQFRALTSRSATARRALRGATRPRPPSARARPRCWRDCAPSTRR